MSIKCFENPGISGQIGFTAVFLMSTFLFSHSQVSEALFKTNKQKLLSIFFSTKMHLHLENQK